MLYIVLKKEAAQDSGFLKVLLDTTNFVRSVSVTRRTPFIILSEPMYLGFRASMCSETPFNSFKLSDRNVRSVVGNWKEERFVSSFDGYASSDKLFPNDVLFRETAVVMGVAVSDLCRKEVAESKFNTLYYYNRVLGTSLALEKGVIAEPYTGHVIDCYKKYFPETKEFLERFDSNYLGRDMDELTGKELDEMSFESYNFLKSIVSRMGEKL